MRAGIFLLAIFLAFYLPLLSVGQETRLKTGIVLDSLNNEVDLLLDVQGRPVGFVSSVFTPVCGTGECLPIHIELYWDLSGKYSKFDFKNGDSLTKVDHLPFTANDYLWLDRILRNDLSPLKGYSLAQLYSPKEPDSVDGFTGSTIPALEGAYVPGALFTSFTLWHLCNGKSVDYIKGYSTTELLRPDLLPYYLQHPELGLQKKALFESARLSTDISNYLFSVIDTTDNAMTISALELVFAEQANESFNEVLIDCYKRSKNYQVVHLLLNHWQGQGTNEKIQLTVTQNLGARTSTFREELEFIELQRSWWDSVYYALVEQIQTSTNLRRKEAIKNVLDNRSDSFNKKFSKYYAKALSN